MVIIPAFQWGRHFAIAGGTNTERTLPHFRAVMSLSSWMLILGTIGFICALTDYASTFVDSWKKAESAPSQARQWFFDESNPIMPLIAAWPLVLAVALRRTGWRQWLAASALTFLFLSIGECIDASSAWNRPREIWLPVGSFRVNRADLFHFSPSAAALLLVGSAQIIAHFGIGLRALRLLGYPALGPIPTPSAKPTHSRRAQLGRIAVYVSLAYLVLMVRIPVWSAYVDVLNRSRILREYILQNDLDRIRSDRASEPRIPIQPEWLELRTLLDSGARAWSEERYATAKQIYIKFVSVGEKCRPDMQAGTQELFSVGLNNMAWLLATCPDTELRDPHEAISYASKAIALDDKDGNSWNTLGVARFRGGDLKGSREAFERSIAIRKGGDSFDWFFLAILEAKAGQPQAARRFYDQAKAWFHAHRPGDFELHEIQVEAARELGLPESEMTLHQPSPADPKLVDPTPAAMYQNWRKRPPRIIHGSTPAR